MQDRKLIAGLEKAFKAVEEAVALRESLDSMVLAPSCRLDLETHRLLASQASWGRYGEYLSKAVKEVRPWVDDEKIRMIAALVKSDRSSGKAQIIRSRISQEGLSWAEEVAERAGVKTRAVLESVLYLYTRAMT